MKKKLDLGSSGEVSVPFKSSTSGFGCSRISSVGYVKVKFTGTFFVALAL